MPSKPPTNPTCLAKLVSSADLWSGLSFFDASCRDVDPLMTDLSRNAAFEMYPSGGDCSEAPFVDVGVGREAAVT